MQHDNKNYHHIGQKKAAPSTTRTQNAHKRPPLLPQNVNTQHKDSRKKTSRSKYNKKANMNNNEETTSNDDDGDASSSSTGAQDVILEATKFIRRRQQARRRAINYLKDNLQFTVCARVLKHKPSYVDNLMHLLYFRT